MYNTRLFKKCSPLSEPSLFSGTSRNRNISLKNDLKTFISIEPLKAHKTTATTLNFCPNTFYKQSEKASFSLTYAPRKTFNQPKPKYELLRQFSKQNEDIDLASTMLSFGPGINNKDFHEFKTSFLFKFAQAGEVFANHVKYIQFVSNEKQTAVLNYYQKTKRYLDQTNGILFDKIKHNAILDYSSWKQLVTTSYDLFSNMNQILLNLFKDFQDNKDKTDKIIKQCNKELVSMVKSADDISRSSPKVPLMQKQKIIEEAKQVKLRELQKENNQKKIIIHRLESEIRDLTCLLDKNKAFYELYLETNTEVEKLKIENENLRLTFLHDIKESGMKLAVSTNEALALTLALSEVEKEKEKLVSRVEDSKNDIIDSMNQYSKMKNSLNEKIETICMLTEELLIYITMYDEERQHNHLTKMALIALENQVNNSSTHINPNANVSANGNGFSLN